jgi:hypothetical protein
MCQTFSAIYTRNDDLFFAPADTDSHEALIDWRGLDDTCDPHLNNWIRVEYKPRHSDFMDLDSYDLKVDEDVTPVWFDEERRYSCIARLRVMVHSMMVTTRKSMLLGGCWILGKGAVVDRVLNCRIIAMYDAAGVHYMERSWVGLMRDDTFINEACSNSRIELMLGTSTVRSLNGSAAIIRMAGRSRLANMGEQAYVRVIDTNATICQMIGHSFVEWAEGMATIESMYGYSRVGEIADSATVCRIAEPTATVLLDRRVKTPAQ